MSALGRQSARIDLNTATMQSIIELTERVKTTESSVSSINTNQIEISANLGISSAEAIFNDDGLEITPPIDATGLNLKVETNETDISAINNKIGDNESEPKTGLYLDIATNETDIATINNKIGDNASEPKTGIYLDIATHTTDISTINTKIGNNESEPKTGLYLDIETINSTIGNDTIDPKTGIFLELQNLREGHEIIPNYDYTGVYLILLNDLIDTENDPNITINNSENKHLNEILLDMQKKIDILEKNNDLTRGMLTQTGYGLGSTAIRSMATAPILFNSRSLDALGINEGSIPTFSLLDTSQASIDSFAIEISNWIYSVIPAPIMTIFETITGKTKEEFIQDIIRAQNPQKFIEAEFLSRIKIGINGDLYVKPSDSLHPKGIPELAFSYLNASEIITKANNLANIQTIGTGLNLSVLHDLSVDLKSSGGLELSGNQIELTYPIFGIGGAIIMDSVNHIHVNADEITLTFDIVSKHLKISTTYIEEREAERKVLQDEIDAIKVGVGLDELTEAGSGWFDWLEGGFGSLFSVGSDATLAGGIGYVASQAKSANDKADDLLDLITPGSGSHDDNGYFINSGNIGIGYEKNDNIPEKLSVNGNIECDNIKTKAFISPDGTELYLNNVDKRVREEGETTTQISLIDDYHTKIHIDTNYHNKTYIDTNFALKSSLNTFDGNYNSLSDKPNFTKNFIFGESFPQIITNYETGELIDSLPDFRFQVSGDGVAGRGNIANNAMVIRSDTTPFIMALNNQPTGDAILNLQINFDNFVPPTNTEEQQNAVGAQLGYRKSESISEFSGLYFRNLNSSYNVFGGIFTFPNENEWTMVLHDNKNVGIGTVFPSEKLEVNGNIKCDKVFANVFVDGQGVELYIGNVPDDGNNGLTRRSLNDYVQSSDLHIVATSGSYNDLSSKPNLFSGSYNDLSSKPNLFSGSYNDLSSKPDLTVYSTFSGSYNDLSSKPNLFSGSYNDLSSKPDLTVYSTFTGSYNDLSSKPTLFSGLYDDLSSKPDLSVYSTFSGSYNDLSSKPNLFSGSYDDLSSKPDLSVYSTFSGSYNDLTSKPDLSVYSTITQLENYYTKTEVDNIDLNNYAHKQFLFSGSAGDVFLFSTSMSYSGTDSVGKPLNTQLLFTGNDRTGEISYVNQANFYKNDIIKVYAVLQPNYNYQGDLTQQYSYLIYPDGSLLQVIQAEPITLDQPGNYGWVIKDSINNNVYYAGIFENIFIVEDKITYSNDLLPILTYGDNEVLAYLTNNNYIKSDALIPYSTTEYINNNFNKYDDTDVNALLSTKGYLTSHQSLELYALKTELNTYSDTDVQTYLTDNNYITTSGLDLSTYYNKTEVDDLFTNLEIPSSIPDNLLLLPSESYTIQINGVKIIGKQRNYSTTLVQDITTNIYLLRYTSFYFETNYITVYSNDVITIIYENEIIPNYYNATNYSYLRLFYLLKTENVSLDILGRNADPDSNISGIVGKYEIIQNNPQYAQYEQGSDIKTTITFKFPKDVNPLYEYRLGFGKTDNLGVYVSGYKQSIFTVQNNPQSDSINNNYINDLPIDNIVFPNTTGFLKITNGNLSYDTTGGGSSTETQDLSSYALIANTYSQTEINNNFVKNTDLYDYSGIKINNNLLNIIGTDGYISSSYIDQSLLNFIPNYTSIESDVNTSIGDYLSTNNFINQLSAGSGISITGENYSRTITCTLQNTDTTYTGTANQIDISSDNVISISTNFSTYTAGEGIAINGSEISSTVFNTYLIYTPTTNEIDISSGNQISISPVFKQNHTYSGTANEIIIDMDNKISISDNYQPLAQFQFDLKNTNGPTILNFTNFNDEEQQFFKDASMIYLSELTNDFVIERGGNSQNVETHGINFIIHTVSKLRIANSSITASVPLMVDKILFADGTELQSANNIASGNDDESFAVYTGNQNTLSLRMTSTAPVIETVKYTRFSEEVEFNGNISLENINETIYLNFQMYSSADKSTSLKDRADIFLCNDIKQWTFDRLPLSENIDTYGTLFRINYENKLHILRNQIECYEPLKLPKIIFADNTEIISQTGVLILDSINDIDFKISNVSKLKISSTQVESTTDLKVSKIIFADNTELTTAPSGGGGGSVSYPLSGDDIFEVNTQYKSTDDICRLWFIDGVSIINSSSSISLRINNISKLSVNNTDITSQININTPSITFSDGTQLTSATSSTLTFSDILPINTWLSTSDNINRFFFSNNSDSYYRTGNDFRFRNSADKDLLKIKGDTVNTELRITATEAGDAKILFGTPNANSQLNKHNCAIIADGVYSWSRADLCFCVGNVGSNSSSYDATTANARIRIKYNGYTSITGATGYASGWTRHIRYNENYIHHQGWRSAYVVLYVGGSYWAGDYYVSSDSRIKKDIEELEDQECLQKILQLKPCKYRYIDDSKNKSDGKVYGFIAQEIKEVFPEAVSIQKECLPNVMKKASITDKNKITLLESLQEITETIDLQIDMEINIYDINENKITCKIIEKYDENNFKIDQDIEGDLCFVYGSITDDFNTINKEYINCVNISAVQELYKKIINQQEKINYLEAKMKMVLEHLNISSN